MDHPVLQTERLTLRALSIDDAEMLYGLFTDSETMRYWGGFRADTLEATRELIPGIVNGAGAHYWTLWRPGENQSIGYVGFIGNEGVPGFGYALRRDCWGQGFVAEACRAAIDWGFESSGLDRVELWIHEDNLRSLAVARKLQFRAVGQFYRGSDSYGGDPYYYRCFGMLAGDWLTTSGRGRRALFDGVEPVLLVRDIEATAEYYRDRLGFEIGFLFGDPPTHGGVSRSLWTPNRASLQLSLTQGDDEIRPTGWIYFHTGSGIDDLFEEYTANKVQFTRELETMPHGLREFEIVDPNGYRLRFGANP